MTADFQQIDLQACLNESQYRAVTSASRAVLVLAGAGSGKTRVITYRLAHLLMDRATPPHQVLAVTFTNKAAGEMKSRIERLVGPDARQLWVSTFHATAARLLRREIPALGRARDFAIYDTDDTKAVLRECLKELGLPPKEISPEAIRGGISYLKNHLLGPEQAASALARDDWASQRFAAQVAKVFDLYEKRLEAANALDFDDLLVYPLRLFEAHPAILEKYRARFRHLMVDEYQDTNHAQYKLVLYLGRKADSICVVGDDDQSIYRWRGAQPENLDRFCEDFAPVEVIPLEVNYRSTSAILEAASAVVNCNDRFHPKQLTSHKGEGEAIRVLATADGEAEARAVVSLIEAWTGRGADFSLGDCAIFFRTAAQSRALEEVLVNQGIPYTLVGGIRFYERKEIKDVLAYARLALNFRDEQALRRIAGLGHWNVGPRTLDQVFALSTQCDTPPVELSEEQLASALSPRALKAFQNLQQNLLRWSATLHEKETQLADWIKTVIQQSHYMDKLAQQKSDREAKRQLQTTRENLEQLISAAEETTEQFQQTVAENEQGESMTAADLLGLFLEHASLMSDVDYWSERTEPSDREVDVGRVVLMTLHSAKGLEFPVVFIVGCEEDLIPHVRSAIDPEGLQEERRLFYVGMTRAEQRLVLSYAYSRKVFGHTASRFSTRFLKEIPESCLERIGRLDVGNAPKRNQEFQSGDRVVHATFGPGTVRSVSGRGAGLKLQIDFFRHGRKILMQSYAKVKKL